MKFRIIMRELSNDGWRYLTLIKWKMGSQTGYTVTSRRKDKEVFSIHDEYREKHFTTVEDAVTCLTNSKELTHD